MSLVIGICGGSCSGKTTLATHIESKLGADKCARLSQDDYYFPMDGMTFDGPLPNFDHPSTVNFDYITKDLAALKRGETIIPPKYDFATHSHVVDAWCEAHTIVTRGWPVRPYNQYARRSSRDQIHPTCKRL